VEALITSAFEIGYKSFFYYYPGLRTSDNYDGFSFNLGDCFTGSVISLIVSLTFCDANKDTLAYDYLFAFSITYSQLLLSVCMFFLAGIDPFVLSVCKDCLPVCDI